MPSGAGPRHIASFLSGGCRGLEGTPETHVPQALPWTLGVLFQHLPGNLASQELREDS